MTSALEARAACSALYWARLPRRDDDAIRGSLAGLTDDERATVAALLRGGALDKLTDDELLGRMTELAQKTAGVGLSLAPAGKAEATSSGDGHGELTGYAATWDLDRQGEHVRPGAFASTLAAVAAGRAVVPLIVGGHEFADDVGKVVGRVVEAREDARGLWVRAILTSDATAQGLRPALVAGALSLSIGGLIRDRNGRELVDVDLMHVLLTPSPANAGAVVLTGKDAGEAFVDLDAVAAELEHLEMWASGVEATEALASMASNPAAMAAVAQVMLATETDAQLGELERWAATVKRPSEADLRRERAALRREVDQRTSYAAYADRTRPVAPGGCGRCQRCRVGAVCSYA